MDILLREISEATAGGPRSYRDSEFSGDVVTIGSAPNQTVQIIGRDVRGNHARIFLAAGKLVVQSVKGAGLTVDGADTARAELKPGSVLEIAGHRLTAIDPPAGFDAALAIEFNPEVQPADFEAAFRTDLDQTRLSKRRTAWTLSAVLLLLGLVLPWAGLEHLPWWASDLLWSSGPLYPAHAVALGDDCRTCHQRPFQRVPDEPCLACHADAPNHAAEPLHTQVGLAATRCASCHREHNEPAHITLTADALCTSCHADPGWQHPDDPVEPVAGFSLDAHPVFGADLLTASAELRGTGYVYAWRLDEQPLATARDRSNLKFPHDVHLQADRVQDPATGAPLECASCHALAPDDEHFVPVTMETHCRNCHDLKFDRQAPDRELPHGDPEEVLLTMEGHYLKLYADPARNRQTRSRRRLPDRAGDAAERCRAAAHVCAAQRTEREAEAQFTRRGCVTCHEVAVHEGGDLLSRYQVVPVRLTPDFYREARFDHRAHLTQQGVRGDDACVTCHAARSSSGSGDLLMPDLAQCVTCHGDRSVAGVVQLGCIGCHEFHPEQVRAPALVAGGAR